MFLSFCLHYIVSTLSSFTSMSFYSLPTYSYSRYLQSMSTGCCSVRRRSWRRWCPRCQMAGSLSRSAYVPAESRGPDCSGLWVGLMLSWFSDPSVLLPLPEPSPVTYLTNELTPACLILCHIFVSKRLLVGLCKYRARIFDWVKWIIVF